MRAGGDIVQPDDTTVHAPVAGDAERDRDRDHDRRPSVSAAAGPSFDPTGQQVAADIVVTGLDSPVDVTNAGDGSGRLFVVEQAGAIRLIRDGALVDQPFLDIRERIASGGERGLLGLAFHPGYPTDPRFFVDYTDLQRATPSSPRTRSSATAEPDTADPDSETILLQVDQPFAEPQRRRGRVRTGRDALHRHGRRRLGRRPTRQRPASRHVSGQDPAHRRRRRRHPASRTSSQPDNPFVVRRRTPSPRSG